MFKLPAAADEATLEVVAWEAVAWADVGELSAELTAPGESGRVPVNPPTSTTPNFIIFTCFIMVLYALTIVSREGGARPFWEKVPASPATAGDVTVPGTAFVVTWTTKFTVPTG